MAINISKKMTEQEQDYILGKRIYYTSLLLQDFSCREMLSLPRSILGGNNRHKIVTKYRYVKNQLKQLERESGLNKKSIDKSEDMAMNNVGLMATVLGTLAVVPPCQVDFIEKEFERIMVQALDNFIKNKENEDTNEGG